MPASTITRRRSPAKWAPSRRQRSTGNGARSTTTRGDDGRELGRRCAARAGRTGRCRCRWRSSRRRPAVRASPTPATSGTSPARSTSRVGSGCESAIAVAVTVVPLPPLAAPAHGEHVILLTFGVGEGSRCESTVSRRPRQAGTGISPHVPSLRHESSSRSRVGRTCPVRSRVRSRLGEVLRTGGDRWSRRPRSRSVRRIPHDQDHRSSRRESTTTRPRRSAADAPVDRSSVAHSSPICHRRHSGALIVRHLQR